MTLSQPPTKTRPAFSHRTKSAIGALGVIVAGILVIGVMSALKPKPEPEKVDAPPLPKVETVSVSPEKLDIHVTTQGSVTPVRSIKLVAQVAGQVTAVADDYADGGFFQKDQPIVTIDDRDYIFALRQTDADVARAKEAYAMEKGRARQAKREWRDIGDSEANALFLREPQLAAAKAAVEAAQANRGLAELNVARTKISAPFNGRISVKHVDIGQYVAPGTVIAEVFSTDSVQVRLPLTDRQVSMINLPLTATQRERAQLPEVTLSTVHGGDTYTWQGQIVRTEASLDIKSRVIYAVAEVQSPYQVDLVSGKPPLSVGMYVSASIVGKAHENVARLPQKILQKKDKIIVLDDDNKLAYRTVNVLQYEGEDMLVQGLDNGARVMLTRIPFAVAGLEVEPIHSDEAIADAPGNTETPEPQASAQEG